MPCPHSGSVVESLTRRGFLRTALSTGGIGALGACLERRDDDPPRGTDTASLPDRQHAWNDFLPRDGHGNTVLPRYQLLLFFDYAGRGAPTDDERAQVEAALRSLERAYRWGIGEADPYGADGASVAGLLFTVGYSPGYFGRFDADPPVPLPPAADVLDELDEGRSLADDHDVALVLSSDRVDVLLSAELALAGEVPSVNGVPVEASFAGVLARRERRTGFIGRGLPREKLDNDDIPARSPQAMGFKSGFRGNQATEDRVTVADGPFAGGTTQHVSRLAFDLDAWYDRSHEDRVGLMFGPDHDADTVGTTGEFLAGDSAVTRESVARLSAPGSSERAGHTQKLARARDDRFEPRLLRRSEGVSAGDPPALNFTSLQRRLSAFVEARTAMAGADLDVPHDENGILAFVETTARGNYLVPPRNRRALPSADPP